MKEKEGGDVSPSYTEGGKGKKGRGFKLKKE